MRALERVWVMAGRKIQMMAPWTALRMVQLMGERTDQQRAARTVAQKVLMKRRTVRDMDLM
jgi:hypothetical protein